MGRATLHRPSKSVKITLYNNQQALSIDPSSLEAMVEHLLNAKGITCDEVIIHLVDKVKITQLHKDFFNDPTPTDCISFPLDGANEDKHGYSVLGEIFVCPEVAIEYTSDDINDAYEETALYIVHGILHLLGYDDIEELDRRKMKREEKRCMQMLAKHSLFLTA